MNRRSRTPRDPEWGHKKFRQEQNRPRPISEQQTTKSA